MTPLKSWLKSSLPQISQQPVDFYPKPIQKYILPLVSTSIDRWQNLKNDDRGVKMLQTVKNASQLK